MFEVSWLSKPGNELGRPIGGNDEDVSIHGQVLAISATYIESNRSWGKLPQKVLYDGPRLSQ